MKRRAGALAWAALACAALAQTAQAEDLLSSASSSGGAQASLGVQAAVQPWMSPEVGAAWSQGYKGQGTRVTFVDDYASQNRFSGNLGDGVKTMRHGEWTLKEASMVAPQAQYGAIDFNNNAARVSLAPGLNVVNASYGLYAASGYSPNQVVYGGLQKNVADLARYGQAVVSKAAGNDAVAMGQSAGGKTDYLNAALRGAPSVIFVGALDRNGSVSNKANLASYSNRAGTDLGYQSRFLTVGVAGSQTGLYGTSFAAPEISAYSAILGSKFPKATASQVSNQLLNTARTDTINNYNPAVHGRGEASLTRALAPVSLK